MCANGPKLGSRATNESPEGLRTFSSSCQPVATTMTMMSIRHDLHAAKHALNDRLKQSGKIPTVVVVGLNRRQDRNGNLRVFSAII